METKRLILYGAGLVGRKIAEYCARFNLPVECMCDRDSGKHGKIFSGYVVKSVDEVKGMLQTGLYSLCLSLCEENAAAAKNWLIDECGFDSLDFYDVSGEDLIIKYWEPQADEFRELRRRCVAKSAKNYTQLSEAQTGQFADFLKATRFKDSDIEHSESAKSDFNAHLYYRYNIYQKHVVPWLESFLPLDGASILEIGCGTGASTAAFCEQGAVVHGIDVIPEPIEVAAERLRIYGLSAKLYHMNATEIRERFRDKFDAVIFTASMEHMTYDERLKSIKAAFETIKPDGFVILADTPNRLWHTDEHTSFESFFNWLPDELAMDYARLTRREGFNRGFDREKDALEFARWGRGVSYHEFEVALGKDGFAVASSRDEFFCFPESLYKKTLIITGPEHVHSGFYNQYLNIALKRSDSHAEVSCRP